MINWGNYYKVVQSLNPDSLPKELAEGYRFLEDVTDNGKSWNLYHDDNTIRETVDIYFQKLSGYLENQRNQSEKKVADKSKTEKKAVHSSVPKVQKTRTPAKSGSAPKKESEETVQFTERIPEELRFIRRFINLDGKTKTKDEVLRFVNALQKAMLEKRIRKTSPYAKEILMVQEKLITLFHSMRAKARVNLKPETVSKLKRLTGGEKVMPEIIFLKRYLNLNGKAGMKKKAAKLAAGMITAVKKKQVAEKGPYSEAMNKAFKNLSEFSKDKKIKTLVIEKAELNGLTGLLNGISGLNGIPEDENGVQVMNSMDFVQLKFEKLGFTGKWYDLIGDPAPGFTVMVFGKPKLGKSFLCVDFAGYLAQCHGSVYYAAKEEGLDSTLQEKLKGMAAMHPNFYVANGLIQDLSPYDFIFIDSVTNMGLRPEDLNDLKQQWPGKSFIFIFQTTKQGDFRGAQSFMHDVDAVIEVPEKGKAVQMGRFNQGGEMDIFPMAA